LLIAAVPDMMPSMLPSRGPALKLSVYNLPWPTDWGLVFGVDRPLVLEIGFGNGEFLNHLYAQYPEHHIIGVEVSNQSLVKGEARLSAHGLGDRVQVVYGPGLTALAHLFLPDSLDHIVVNNPDPWFKTRHEGKRLIQRDTVDWMASRLAPGGRLHLATDVAAYAHMSDEVLSSTAGLVNVLPEGWVHELPDRPSTKYQRRGDRMGHQMAYFVYERSPEPLPYRPVVQEHTMPHATLTTPLTLDQIAEAFERHNYRTASADIAYVQAYLATKTGSLLVETTIAEPTIQQTLALMILARREPNAYMVRVGGIGHARPTDGVHRAVALLVDWVVGLHTEGQVVSLKVRR
jgi:tRNA (guanine-N7-)-methyltransferase